MLWVAVQEMNLREHEHEMFLRRSAVKDGKIPPKNRRIPNALHLPCDGFVVVTHT